TGNHDQPVPRNFHVQIVQVMLSRPLDANEGVIARIHERSANLNLLVYSAPNHRRKNSKRKAGLRRAVESIAGRRRAREALLLPEIKATGPPLEIGIARRCAILPTQTGIWGIFRICANVFFAKRRKKMSPLVAALSYLKQQDQLPASPFRPADIEGSVLGKLGLGRQQQVLVAIQLDAQRVKRRVPREGLHPEKKLLARH